ncbi:hypothetical protein P7C73_g6174, partial [Tremellales sp. Uapishka_1]
MMDKKVTLKYRPVQQKDYALLRQFRVECGWGIPKLDNHWLDPDWPLCVFYTETDDGQDEVGMGGWVLDMPEDQDAASRALRNVHLTSLYIQHRYRGAQLGTQALAMLEIGAKEQFDARYVTLMTTAYHTDWNGEHWVENVASPSRSSLWYKGKGYEEFRPRTAGILSPIPENPDRTMMSVWMRKGVEQPS